MFTAFLPSSGGMSSAPMPTRPTMWEASIVALLRSLNTPSLFSP